MHRLVHPRHAPAADPFENPVVPQEEVIDMAARQEAGLIFGDVILVDEPFEELRDVGRVLRLGSPALAHREHLSGGHELAANQEAAQILDLEVHNTPGEFSIPDISHKGKSEEHTSELQSPYVISY